MGLVASQARTVTAALEHRIGTRVPPDARILCWLVEFPAHLMNRCDIGSDRRTPLHKLQGRRDKHTDPGIRSEGLVHVPNQQEGEHGSHDSNQQSSLAS